MSTQRRYHLTWHAAVVLVALAGCPKSGERAGAAPPQKAAKAAPAKGASAKKPVAPAAGTRQISGVGFQTPESVRYDADGDRYLVANINGSPLAADNNGFISVLSPAGSVVALKWIEGGKGGVALDAPKGMALLGDTLHVADISRVRLFGRKSGKPLGTIEIPGATFVNDVAAGADAVYVSDSGASSGAVWRIGRDRKPVVVLKGPALKRPNGLVVDGDELIVATLGGAEVYRIKGGAKKDVKRAPQGALDGLVLLADRTLLVSSWAGKAVYRVSADGTFSPVVSGVNAPADIGFDSKRRRILIPLFNDNAVRIVALR